MQAASPTLVGSMVLATAYVAATSRSTPELAVKLIALGMAAAGWLRARATAARSMPAATPAPATHQDDSDALCFVKREGSKKARDVTLEETIVEEKVENGRMVRTCSKRMATIVCPPEENEKHIQMFLKNDRNVLDAIAAPPAEPSSPVAHVVNHDRSTTERYAKDEANEAHPWSDMMGPAATWLAEKAWTTVSEGLVTIALWSICGVLWNSANNFNSDATFWSLFWKKLQDEFNTT
ncbi:hypothetical protein SPRG_12711 [Saprolegnia parasitica CBS 223.65]|uniref:Uncharacterized protein n=1 Tax=Saprolegnia parasitica (strain CBS 223.65) TaxID=695850 RepID=A0A067BZZ4_SAPPC|nr:hypothetical protein SPRG_12711 [Saprolegnia parasitica CBS 223.65]KDO22430.1 hypothetical protein SPRG_12711 [Saprolegnia parasitica CBS 223.65]|eukprot:XP_012206818.1 hypothetical protein SPRG_12711 [Saprolegnia parasitica CBS 223.65]